MDDHFLERIIVHTEVSLGQAVVMFGSILSWRDQTLFPFSCEETFLIVEKLIYMETALEKTQTCFFSHTLISLKQE